MRVYLHTHDNIEPALIEINHDLTVTDFLADVDGELLFVENAEIELDSGATLEVVGVTDLGHLAAAHCRTVEVFVRYNGETKMRTFSPSARVRKVTDWATGHDGFNLPAAEVARHVLELPGHDTRVPERTLLVSIASREDCTLRLDLQPKIRHEG